MTMIDCAISRLRRASAGDVARGVRSAPTPHPLRRQRSSVELPTTDKRSSHRQERNMIRRGSGQ